MSETIHVIPKLVYFIKSPLKIVVATRPTTGSAIIYRSLENRWGISPHDYPQIISDTHYHEISQQQAQSVYKNVEPDIALLDRLDNLRKGVVNGRET